MADFVLRVEAEVSPAADDLRDVGFVFFDAEAKVPSQEGFNALLNAGMHNEAWFGKRAEHVPEDLLDLRYFVDFVERVFEVGICGVEIAKLRDSASVMVSK